MHKRIIILCLLAPCLFLFIPWVCYGDETAVFFSNASITSSAAMGTSPFKQRLEATAPSSQLLHWWDQRVN